jgi:hypothetical protein
MRNLRNAHDDVSISRVSHESRVRSAEPFERSRRCEGSDIRDALVATRQTSLDHGGIVNEAVVMLIAIVSAVVLFVAWDEVRHKRRRSS